MWSLVKPELLKLQGAGVGKGRITIENSIALQDLCRSRAKADKDGCQLLPIQENFDLRECQSPVNWELVNEISSSFVFAPLL